MQSASMRARTTPVTLHGMLRTVVKSSDLYVTRTMTFAPCEANAGTNSASGSAGDRGSPSNKKAVVIGHLTASAHLLCKACGPTFMEEFDGASASVEHGKPLRGNCPLCGEYIKHALLEIRSGYSDDSAQDLARRKKLSRRSSRLSTKVKALILTLLGDNKASTASNPISRFVFTLPSVHI